MRGVEIALDRLQPVAAALHEAVLDLVLRQERGFERRQVRRALALAHIDPDEAVLLGGEIGLGAHLVLEILVRRHVGHLETVAIDVVFPAVIDAAQTVLLVAPVEEGGAAMRAAVVEHADPAGAVAKRHQLLAEQHEADGRAVGHEFGGKRRRNPVLPHEAAHRRAGAGVRQAFVAIRHGVARVKLFPRDYRNFIGASSSRASAGREPASFDFALRASLRMRTVLRLARRGVVEGRTILLRRAAAHSILAPA